MFRRSRTSQPAFLAPLLQSEVSLCFRRSWNSICQPLHPKKKMKEVIHADYHRRLESSLCCLHKHHLWRAKQCRPRDKYVFITIWDYLHKITCRGIEWMEWFWCFLQPRLISAYLLLDISDLTDIIDLSSLIALVAPPDSIALSPDVSQYFVACAFILSYLRNNPLPLDTWTLGQQTLALQAYELHTSCLMSPACASATRSPSPKAMWKCALFITIATSW